MVGLDFNPFDVNSNIGLFMFSETENAEFTKVLRAKIKEFFSQNNLESRGGIKSYLKTNFILLGLALSYISLIILGSKSYLFVICFYILTLFFQIASVLAVMHDASHNALFKKRWLNRIICYLIFHCAGCSSYLWQHKHVKAHHHNTNILGQDHDIDGGNIFKFSSEQPTMSHHKYQYLYAIPLYLFLIVKWIIHDDLRDLIRNKYNFNAKQRLLCFADILSTRIVYLSLSIIIPTLVLGSPVIVMVCWFIYNALFGLMLTLIFQCAHVNTKTKSFSAFKPRPHMFIPLQLLTTADFATNNKFITWYFGGLNFQVIHHLFPTICHIHYPALQGILKQTLKSYPKYKYHEFSSFPKAIVNHLKALKTLGSISKI